MKMKASLGVLLFGLAGCTWVDPQPDSEHVMIIDANLASHCDYKGDTSVNTLNNVWFVNRGQEKVKKELETLARNKAVSMGGNAMIAKSKPADGGQMFAVYRCK